MGDDPEQCAPDSNSDSLKTPTPARDSQNTLSDSNLENTELLVEADESQDQLSADTTGHSSKNEFTVERNLSTLATDGSSFCCDSSVNRSTGFNMECHSSSHFESPVLSSETVLASTPHVSQSIKEINIPHSQKRRHELIEHQNLTPVKRLKSSSEVTDASSGKEEYCTAQDMVVGISDVEKSFSHASNGSWKSHHYNSWGSHNSLEDIRHKSPMPSQEIHHDSANCLYEKKIDDLQKKIKGCREIEAVKRLSLDNRNGTSSTSITEGAERFIHEKFNANVTVSFKVDDKCSKIVSTAWSLLQINESDESRSPASSSGNSYKQEPYPLPPTRLSIVSVNSTSSSSTGTSFTSGIIRKTDGNHQFTIPSAPFYRIPVKSAELLNLKYPQGCTCTCYCSIIYKSQTKKLSNTASPRTPDLLSSSSKESSYHTVQEEHDVLCEKQKSCDTENNHGEPKMEYPVEKSNSSVGVDQSSLNNISLSESRGGLMVFAKWFGSTVSYPGIVRGANGRFWQQRFSLKVNFFDGTIKRINSISIFPAHFLQPGAKVLLHGDSHSSLYTVVSIERNETAKKWGRKMWPTYVLKNNNGMKKVNFEEIVIPQLTYEQLEDKIRLALSPTAMGVISTGAGQRSLLRKSSKIPMVRKKYSHNTPSHTDKESPKPPSTCDLIVKTAEEVTSSSKELNESNAVQEAFGGECSMKNDTNKPDHSDAPLLKSSDTDSSVSTEERLALDKMKGQGLESEWILESAKKLIRDKKSKSSSRIPVIVKEDKIVTNRLGPIPESALFKGYCYVLTHSKKTVQFPAGNSSSASSETDLEDYYSTDIPFDRMRLQTQIRAGGGMVFDFLTNVPKELLPKCLLFTDFPCRTPNYLFAIVQGVPIYRHDLIVQCCLENKPISQQIKHGILLPPGRSLEACGWITERRSNALRFHVCLLALTDVSDYVIKLWKKLIEYMGAKVVLSSKPDSIPGGFSSISFILANEGVPKELVDVSLVNRIPIVSTVWIIESIIHGSPRDFNSLPHYNVPISTA